MSTATEPQTRTTEVGESRRSGRWRGVLAVLGVVLLLGVGTIAATWPAARSIDTAMIGGSRDGPMFLWNFWWAKHAAFDLHTDPLRTDHLFAPEGTRLVVHTHHVLPALATAFLEERFGVIAALNVATLLSYVLAGLGVFLLASEVVKDRRAGLVAGVAFAFGAYRTSFVMFPNLIQSGLLALYAWALWTSWTRRCLGFAGLAGVLAGALVYTSYNLLVLAALFTLPFLVYALGASPSRSAPPWKGVVLRALVTAITAGAIGAPLFWAMKKEIDEQGFYVELENNQAYDESVPLERYLVPPSDEKGGEDALTEASFLGWSVLALAVLGTLSSLFRPRLWFWWVVALGFLACSLGPKLDLTGLVEDPAAHAMRLPFHWLRDLPVLGQVRVAHRYGIVGVLALCVVAAFGARAVLGWIGRGRVGGTLVTAVLVALTFFEFLDSPFKKLYVPPAVPAAIAAITDDPRDCLVLEYPAGRSGYKPFSWFETVHGKPVYLDGQIARRIPRFEDARKASRLYQVLDDAFAAKRRSDVQLSRERYVLADEIDRNRIGWLVVAGSAYREERSRDGAPRGRVEAIRRLVENAFPVEEVVMQMDPEELAAWEALRPAERRSTPCVVGVYKLRYRERAPRPEEGR